MGRLFWKFFVFVWLAQLVTIVGVGVAIGLKHRLQDDQFRPPPMADRLGRAADVLRFGGPNALRALLQAQPDSGVLAVDDAGREMLARNPSADLLAEAKHQAARTDHHAWARQVQGSDGQTLLLIAQMPAGPGGPIHGQGGPHDHHFMPIEPIIGGILASLISALLLAWYIAKPIRHLRAAFASAATGDLKVRIADAMGSRRDELADLGRDFDRMAGQLGALMVGQTRLLHDVSHELRSPLARLQAAIGLARQQPERVAESMGRIERESVRMDRLVGELLTLSRLDAGVAGRMDEAVDMGELVGGIVDDAGFEAESTGRQLNYQDGGTALVQGQAELLHRAVENVVRNAVRYTFEGRCVSVSTGFEAGRYRILVADQGPGVAESELDSIFEPFFRAPGNPNPDGHGLGLAIAKRVVQAHGGSITAQNRPEGGLLMTLAFPATAVV